jgi:hypothetical protein
MNSTRPQPLKANQNSQLGGQLQPQNLSPQQGRRPAWLGWFFLLGLIIIAVVEFFLIKQLVCSDEGSLVQAPTPTPAAQAQPAQGMMILIEYKDTVGLVNFVNELRQRNIPGLLHVAPEFVEANCDTIKELLKYDMEIMASLGGGEFWDMPYEDQKQKIAEMVDQVEACTQQPVKIISSRYMASDLNTLKAADELGIPYVTARGTTDSKASVYAVEGYDAKILSVSNIPKVQFKYGSLCDYSFYERAGTPDDMLAELMRAIEPLTSKEQERYGQYHRVTPVTHTNIGGYLKPWTDMWINFWDSTQDQIEWVSLDEFMAKPDWILPDWQVPINKNAPYTPEKIRPLMPYEEVEKVENPCRVEDLRGSSFDQSSSDSKVMPSPNSESTSSASKVQTETQDQQQVVMFHNNQGPMCLEALDFFKKEGIEVQEVLNTDPDFRNKLQPYQERFPVSLGVSESYGYYPFIFTDQAGYSGFNAEIKQQLMQNL